MVARDVSAVTRLFWLSTRKEEGGTEREGVLCSKIRLPRYGYSGFRQEKKRGGRRGEGDKPGCFVFTYRPPLGCSGFRQGKEGRRGNKGTFIADMLRYSIEMDLDCKTSEDQSVPHGIIPTKTRRLLWICSMFRCFTMGKTTTSARILTNYTSPLRKREDCVVQSNKMTEAANTSIARIRNYHIYLRVLSRVLRFSVTTAPFRSPRVVELHHTAVPRARIVESAVNLK